MSGLSRPPGVGTRPVGLELQGYGHRRHYFLLARSGWRLRWAGNGQTLWNDPVTNAGE